LSEWKESIADQWSRGVFQHKTSQETFTANAQALGQLQVLRDLEELEYDQLVSMLHDD
jgi:hypothetical protein